MKEIPLTQGKIAIVDDCDYEYLMQWKWYYNSGYAKRHSHGKILSMHRVILERINFTLGRMLKIKGKLDYRRCVLDPPLDTSEGTKEITLTQDKVALVSSVDYHYLMQWNWCFSYYGYAVRKEGGKILYMHLVIAERMLGGTFKFIDHTNCNSLDNQRENLRPASKAENAWNVGKSKTNNSGYKGVSWSTATNKWRARIRANSTDHHLGVFDDKIDAARAYDKAAEKLHGEFANINKV